MIPPPSVASAPPAFASRPPSLLMAHRGAPSERAENSIPSFASAVDAGADVLEMDIRETQDGVWVIAHDNHLLRTMGLDDDISSVSYARLSGRALVEPKGCHPHLPPAFMPRLQDVLLAFPDASFNIDVKDAPGASAASVFEVIRDARRVIGKRQDILLTSEGTDTQATILACNQGEVSLGMGFRDVMQVLMGAYLGFAPPDRLRGRAFQAPMYERVGGVCIPIVTDQVIAYVKQMGSPIHVWWEGSHNVDDPTVAQSLFARGIDGVFTNRIRDMTQALRDPNKT